MNEKKQQTVCFTGHRQMEEMIVNVEYKITKIVEDLIQNYSSVCIAYMTRQYSGTSYTVNYAKAKKLQVFNIATIND